MKLFNKIINDLSYLFNERLIKKYASLADDLQKEPDLQKFFVTEEEAKEKLRQYEEEKKKKYIPYYSSDYDWYKIEGESVEFYLYQDFSIGISDILYARCKILQLDRLGYDDPVSIAGLYEAEGTELISYKIFYDKTYNDAMNEIIEYGIHDKGNKHHYICNKELYTDLNELKPIAIRSVKEKDKNTGQTFKQLNQ